jgi:squalene-hopene/tetraprenyl-beta-curcumene cyclase
MNPGWNANPRLSQDDLVSDPSLNGSHRLSRRSAPTSVSAERLENAIRKTRDYLLSKQADDGSWCAELEGDTILESEYILLLAYLGRGQSEIARECAGYIAQQQLPTGGWAIYPGGPLEISASVKAYWALKITGTSPHSPGMQRAREAILAAGGAEQVNSFTRYYFALLGIIRYEQCPAVPPELMLLPKWAPFNIYEMSAWSRTILVPLSLLWAFQPASSLPKEHGIDELFLRSPAELPISMGPSAVVDKMKKRTWVPWSGVFRTIDRVWKMVERVRLLPMRRRSIRLAGEWMIERLADSDGLGAIFPPIIWSVVALKCLGHGDDSPLVQAQLAELEKLTIREDGTARLQPCKSPVWDTAIATIALRDAGVPPEHPAIRKSVQWLLGKEIRTGGDWTVRDAKTPPSGWAFEYNNRFYPDVDDTSMVVMALAKSLGSPEDWRLDFGFKRPDAPAETTAVLAARTNTPEHTLARIEAERPVLQAINRGASWIRSMQNRDGGWGAFDRDNDREVLTRVPFADHNAMIDPSTADLTARALEMYGMLGMTPTDPTAFRALEFVYRQQEPDHCWFGRWGVNYIYGTWQVLLGLDAMGIPNSDPQIRKAVAWFKTTQQKCGGWGESPETYDRPHLRGQGPATASQTAWAIMGLIAAGEANSTAVDEGIRFLLDTQRTDGNWDEPFYTGTGFPRVFYLRYHFYRTYFPLMALARAAAARRSDPVESSGWIDATA